MTGKDAVGYFARATGLVVVLLMIMFGLAVFAPADVAARVQANLPTMTTTLVTILGGWGTFLTAVVVASKVVDMPKPRGRTKRT